MARANRLRRWLALAAIVAVVLGGVYMAFDTETLTLDQRTRSRLPGQFIRLSLGYTRYQLHQGQGTPVVLVHGFSTPMFVWDRTYPALVKAGFTVLRYDLYGIGYSDRPRVDYDEDLYVRQLDELIDALGLPTPVDLVGLSMGGAIVVLYTAKHPDKVRRLVLVDPAGFPLPLPFLARLVRLPVVGEWLMRVAGRAVLLSKLKKTFYDQSIVPHFRDKFRAQLEYKGYQRAMLSNLRHFDLCNQQAAFRAVGKSGKPVLLFWGKQDKVIPPANARLVKAAIPQAKLYLVDQAGHLPQYEKPQEVNPVLIEFLRQP